MPRTLETNVGIATFLQTAELFGLGLDYDLRLPDLISAVTREQVHEAARATLDPSHATIVVAGPYSARCSEAHSPAARRTAAVFFDVDFTLIYPGPTFQGEGYRRFCAKHGITVDQGRFGHAVRAASVILDFQQQHVYDAEIFVRYTQRIIEEMGGTGPALTACATEIYDEWAACHHFHLYDDVSLCCANWPARCEDRADLELTSVPGVLRAAFRARWIDQRRDLIIRAWLSEASPQHLRSRTAAGGVRPEESVMVGDSLLHDIEGARSVGMRGVLVHRGAGRAEVGGGIPVIRDLSELLQLI
jgi:hypothetical protein